MSHLVTKRAQCAVLCGLGAN